MSEFRLAFVGGEENTLCFRGMGIDVFVAYTSQELSKVLPTLRRNQYAVIFTEWKFYDMLKDYFEDLKAEALPVILGIPTRSGEAGRGADFIKKLVEIAIGSNVLLQGEE
ncbi:MAG: V-type ATP synthase subunit F [Candidatus Caldatribacteriaceae bacterium]